MTFKCFFSYYGSKAKIAKHYTSPEYDNVIEPFCGAANYSIRHFENNIWLSDLHENVIKTWQYLICASEKDIKSLPKVHAGFDIRNIESLSEGERLFMGWWASRGSIDSRNVFSKFALGNSNGADYFENIKNQVADNLYRIRHWNVALMSYLDINTTTNATWFIDPPYQFGGEHYKHSNIDYDVLSEWISKRNGQIIVCENDKSNWIKGQFLVECVGAVRKTNEIVFER